MFPDGRITGLCFGLVQVNIKEGTVGIPCIGNKGEMWSWLWLFQKLYGWLWTFPESFSTLQLATGLVVLVLTSEFNTPRLISELVSKSSFSLRPGLIPKKRGLNAKSEPVWPPDWPLFPFISWDGTPWVASPRAVARDSSCSRPCLPSHHPDSSPNRAVTHCCCCVSCCRGCDLSG